MLFSGEPQSFVDSEAAPLESIITKNGIDMGP